MSEAAGEHERTMAFAEIAFGQIKALRQPATPAQLRGLVHLRDRLQPLAQPDHQRNAGAERHADRRRSRTGLRHLHFVDPLQRQDRQRRLAGDGRDRPGHGDDGRRGRLRQLLHREPDQRHRQARQLEGPRRPARDRRKPGGDRQRDEAEQPRARAAAQRVEGGNQPASGKSRGRPHREPDRSAHRARQPQALRRKPGAGDRGFGRAQRAAVAGDDRHRPFQEHSTTPGAI